MRGGLEEGRRERRRTVKICFWNVAGLRYLCEDTWEYLKGFDVIGLMETWLEEESSRKIKGDMSKKFRWYCIAARKENKREQKKI